jgi:hypothetical protein
MKPPPIPPYTMANLCGAVGDLLRAATVYGQQMEKGEPPAEVYQLVAQFTVQLLTLCAQREPTQDEIDRVFYGPDTQPV